MDRKLSMHKFKRCPAYLTLHGWTAETFAVYLQFFCSVAGQYHYGEPT